MHRTDLESLSSISSPAVCCLKLFLRLAATGTVILLLLAGISPAPAAAMPSESASGQTDESMSEQEARICRLTDAVLRKEMDLERFYLQYRLVGADEPHWRAWRYFLGQSTSAGLIAASDTVNVAAFSRSFIHPVGNLVLRKSCDLGFLGGTIGCCSDGFEVCSNALNALRNFKNGRHPTSAAQEVKAKLGEIDSLLRERETLLSVAAEGPEKKISTLEGQMLRSLRNWCAYEFADIYANVRSFHTSNNFYWCLDGSANALYAVAYGLQFDGIAHPGFNGIPAIVGMIGSSMITVNYPGTAQAQKLLYRRYFNLFARSLGEPVQNTREDASRGLACLDTLSRSSSQESLSTLGHFCQRLVIYRLWSQKFDEYLDKETTHQRRMNRVALQNQVTGPLIGGSSLAQDIMDNFNFYRIRHNARVSQRLAAAGCISGVAGSGASMLLTYQGFIQDLRYRQKLNKNKSAPSDFINKRIETLNELQVLLEEKTR